MRQYKELLQKFLRNSIYAYRMKKEYSQERMAEILHVSTRSYIEQEHGRYGFSALSLIFYLMSLTEEEMMEFVRGFRKKLEKEEEKHEDVA